MVQDWSFLLFYKVREQYKGWRKLTLWADYRKHVLQHYLQVHRKHRGKPFYYFQVFHYKTEFLLDLSYLQNGKIILMEKSDVRNVGFLLFLFRLNLEEFGNYNKINYLTIESKSIKDGEINVYIKFIVKCQRHSLCGPHNSGWYPVPNLSKNVCSQERILHVFDQPIYT